jgi:hypothetical protein
VKDGDDLAVFIDVAVRADEVAADVEVAGESVDGGVVIFRTAGSVVVAIVVTIMLGLVVGTTRCQGEGSEVVPRCQGLCGSQKYTVTWWPF